MLADGIEGKPIPLEDRLSPSGMGLSKDWIPEQATATANMAERVWPASVVEIEELENFSDKRG